MDPIEQTTRVRKSSSIFFEEGADTVSQLQREREEQTGLKYSENFCFFLKRARREEGNMEFHNL